MRLLHVDELAVTPSDAAVSALIEEAELTPKPALVDQRSSGAHHDLDLPRLRRSARSLHDGFDAIARAASARAPSALLREELACIGRDMERRMLEATGGSNAHRGAIWALGLLVAAAAQHASRSSGTASALATTAAAVAAFPDPFAPAADSHGDRARMRFGVSGARGEAQAGFPHALSFGLPVLRASRQRGIPETCARLDALMAIMARLDDTCLLHRGGLMALVTAKAGARSVLAAGGSSTPHGLHRLHQLHADLMDQWASPGGSGDLLAVTLFLDRWEEGPPSHHADNEGAEPWRL